MYGIFTHIYHKFEPNLGKYSSPMEHLGYRYKYPYYSYIFNPFMGDLPVWDFKISTQQPLRIQTPPDKS